MGHDRSAVELLSNNYRGILMTAALHLAMKAVQQQSDIAAVNGAVSWRLPLDLPTGRNGASPSFNIEYSSHRGNDICGVGMGLRGVSAMRRRERQPGPWATRPLLLEGVGALVEVSKGVWRPEHSALSCRAVAYRCRSNCS